MPPIPNISNIESAFVRDFEAADVGDDPILASELMNTIRDAVEAGVNCTDLHLRRELERVFERLNINGVQFFKSTVTLNGDRRGVGAQT